MNHRIIARLDIKGPNLVKGIHLEGLRVLGKPWEFARHYYEAGFDELIYQDVVASLYQRNSLHEFISRTAGDIFVPLTVGGGLRSLSDMRAVLRAGADKVAINTAAVAHPDLIRQAAHAFGSSTITVAIEAIRDADGKYYVYTDNGRETTGLEVACWARRVEDLGAGEILLTSVDREGTGEGFDHELIELVNRKASIPVIAHGGAGNNQDIVDAIVDDGADAVAIASLCHYGTLRYLGGDDDFDDEGNTEFLRRGVGFKHFDPAWTVVGLKGHLADHGVPCRPPRA